MLEKLFLLNTLPPFFILYVQAKFDRYGYSKNRWIRKLRRNDKK